MFAQFQHHHRHCRAVVSLELLLALPVMILVLLGIIELSLIYEVNKRVSYASRFGAKIASETTRDHQQPVHLANLVASGTLRSRLDNHLQTSGLTGVCGVVLEHNACVENPLQLDVDSGCECPPPLEPLPGGEPGEAAYARVTVCVPLRDNVADLLQSFGGFSIVNASLRHSTVFRIEDDNRPPQVVFTTNGGGAPPTVTPPTGLLELTLPAQLPSDFTMNFDGSLTSDREQPTSALSFQWAIDTDGNGSLDSSPSGMQVSAAFRPPAPGSLREYDVVLTATDNCSASGQTTLRIRARREQP